MAEIFDIVNNRTENYDADTTLGSTESFQFNFNSIATSDITAVTWYIKGGQAVISNEQLSGNIASADINFTTAGSVLLEVVAEYGTETTVFYVDITVRNTYPAGDDYQFYDGAEVPPNSGYPVPYVTFEGTETLTNKTIIAADNDLDINGLITAGTNACVALFQDSTANALAAVRAGQTSTAGRGITATFRHYMVAGTTSATTFKVRIGADSAATITFNGSGGSQIYGGVMASSIAITEYAV